MRAFGRPAILHELCRYPALPRTLGSHWHRPLVHTSPGSHPVVPEQLEVHLPLEHTKPSHWPATPPMHVRTPHTPAEHRLPAAQSTSVEHPVPHAPP